MAKRNKNIPKMKDAPRIKPTITSLYDIMEDGLEYSSLMGEFNFNVDMVSDLKKGIQNIESIRQRPLLIYAANMINPSVASAGISIDLTDYQPFLEVFDNIDNSNGELDILLVTPGGSAEQVNSFVEAIRRRFHTVSFIIPFLAMSAGTIFSLSGDELLMDSRSAIGPIDPQVMSKDGQYRPAQSVLTFVNDLKKAIDSKIMSGQTPDWTDVQMLLNIDPKEIGNASNASSYSIQLVKKYLATYKFKTWTTTQSQGMPVTDDMKEQRAKEVAEQLCDHTLWLSHGDRIGRDRVVSTCNLQVTNLEDIPGLESAVRKLWAVLYFGFEKSMLAKVIMSSKHSIFKHAPSPEVKK